MHALVLQITPPLPQPQPWRPIPCPSPSSSPPPFTPLTRHPPARLHAPAGGVCGTCVSKLVSGQVDLDWLTVLDDGNVLSKEQIEAGYILPCSAKPLSDCVVEIK